VAGGAAHLSGAGALCAAQHQEQQVGLSWPWPCRPLPLSPKWVHGTRRSAQRRLLQWLGVSVPTGKKGIVIK
jgi:hypothetical protein